MALPALADSFQLTEVDWIRADVPGADSGSIDQPETDWFSIWHQVGLGPGFGGQEMNRRPEAATEPAEQSESANPVLLYAVAAAQSYPPPCLAPWGLPGAGADWETEREEVSAPAESHPLEDAPGVFPSAAATEPSAAASADVRAASVAASSEPFRLDHSWLIRAGAEGEPRVTALRLAPESPVIHFPYEHAIADVVLKPRGIDPCAVPPVQPRLAGTETPRPGHGFWSAGDPVAGSDAIERAAIPFSSPSAHRNTDRAAGRKMATEAALPADARRSPEPVEGVLPESSHTDDSRQKVSAEASDLTEANDGSSPGNSRSEMPELPQAAPKFPGAGESPAVLETSREAAAPWAARRDSAAAQQASPSALLEQVAAPEKESERLGTPGTSNRLDVQLEGTRGERVRIRFWDAAGSVRMRLTASEARVAETLRMGWQGLERALERAGWSTEAAVPLHGHAPDAAWARPAGPTEDAFRTVRWHLAPAHETSAEAHSGNGNSPGRRREEDAREEWIDMSALRRLGAWRKS